MPDFNDNSKHSDSFLVSRNSPVALVIGVAGFLGSHVAERLLKIGVQVIGIDDFSTGRKENIIDISKEKKFHLINQSIATSIQSFDSALANLKLPRLDYAFFLADLDSSKEVFTHGLDNFLRFVNLTRDSLSFEHQDGTAEHEHKQSSEKPKILFVSSIDLYGKELDSRQEALKNAEIYFAKFVKHYNLNGRVLRLAPVFGPRMHFRVDDPLIALIQAALLDKLAEQNTSIDFLTRAIYISDATDLVLKCVLLGSTAHKIYDGALLYPVKVAEVKQILLDPLWHENQGFHPSSLPPWPTPNLLKTQKELSWESRVHLVTGLKHTLAYFRESDVLVPVILEKPVSLPLNLGVPKIAQETRDWLAGEPSSKEGSKSEKKEEEFPTIGEERKKRKFSGKIQLLLAGVLIFVALVYPFLSILVGSFTIRNDLKAASVALESGDFDKAIKESGQAKNTISEMKAILGWFEIVKKMGVLSSQLEDANSVVTVMEEGILGVNLTIVGSKTLFSTTKIISGEDGSSPRPIYEQARLELRSAREKITKVNLSLADSSFLDKLPGIFKSRAPDLGKRLTYYLNLVEKAEAASVLLPQITAVDGKKSYLVLIQNNLELRPGGGFIGSYAKLDFESGRIKNIKVDDIYNLDGQLKDRIEPPPELKSDLGQNFWYLRDSNFEPDFPTSAKQAEFFYNKEAGERVNGVIGLNLSATAKLLTAIGGLYLPEYNEQVDGSNLFERTITHAEVNFFPGSQAKKNYLTSLQTQLFNKIFYPEKAKWPSIISALNSSLEQKQITIYLAEPSLFSYITSQNWGGVLPRPTETVGGTNKDFLAVVESNMGANKANYYLERNLKLATAVGKEGEVFHTLRINYKNNSPSDVFPAGKYKNRLRIYVPAGATLQKALYGKTEITNLISPFSDYGRSGFSMLLELAPGEQKSLIINYQLKDKLSFKDKAAYYQLDVFKQAGTDKDPFDWVMTYPIHYQLATESENATASSQQLNIATTLSTDRSFGVTFKTK